MQLVQCFLRFVTQAFPVTRSVLHAHAQNVIMCGRVPRRTCAIMDRVNGKDWVPITSPDIFSLHKRNFVLLSAYSGENLRLGRRISRVPPKRHNSVKTALFRHLESMC